MLSSMLWVVSSDTVGWDGVWPQPVNARLRDNAANNWHNTFFFIKLLLSWHGEIFSLPYPCAFAAWFFFYAVEVKRSFALNWYQRGPSSNVFSCRHERLFELLTLVSFYYCIIIFQWFIVKIIWCILRFLSQKRTPVKLCDWSPFQKGMIYSDSTVDVYWMELTMSFFNRHISFIPSFAYTSIPASSA